MQIALARELAKSEFKEREHAEATMLLRLLCEGRCPDHQALPPNWTYRDRPTVEDQVAKDRQASPQLENPQ